MMGYYRPFIGHMVFVAAILGMMAMFYVLGFARGRLLGEERAKPFQAYYACMEYNFVKDHNTCQTDFIKQINALVRR